MKASTSGGAFNFYEGTLLRFKSTEPDYYRTRWYEWNDKMIEKIKKNYL